MDKVKINQCTITLTRKCNLRCNFCYAKKTEYIENDIIDYDDLKKVIDFCDEARVKYIVFTGGEPTLYRSVIDRLKEYPSEECKECSKLSICYGGCPVTWKNFTYRMVQNHK